MSLHTLSRFSSILGQLYSDKIHFCMTALLFQTKAPETSDYFRVTPRRKQHF